MIQTASKLAAATASAAPVSEPETPQAYYALVPCPLAALLAYQALKPYREVVETLVV